MNKSQLHVLIVEDSEDDAELIMRELERNGYDLVWRRVELAEEMSEVLTNQKWDIVLSDYDLPRFSGPDALELTREHDMDIPFIIISGKIGEETAVQTMKAGANDYIMKDNLIRLAPAIERELIEAETRRSRRLAEEALQNTLDEVEMRVEERTSILHRANLALMSEIADRRKVQDELQKSHERLRELTKHLESVRESERSSMAMEIHDELGQSLTAIKLGLGWLRDKLPDDELLLGKVASMSQTVDDTIQKIRTISSELRPAVLDDFGLVTAIEWHLTEFQNQTGIRYEFTAEPTTLELERHDATGLFRIVQEALTNVARHANASKVKVYLRQSASETVLTVTDNGKGITKEKIQSSRSVGLAGMRERALSLKGELSITGSPGKGTIILVIIPRNSTEDTHD